MASLLNALSPPPTPPYNFSYLRRIQEVCSGPLLWPCTSDLYASTVDRAPACAQGVSGVWTGQKPTEVGCATSRGRRSGPRLLGHHPLSPTLPSHMLLVSLHSALPWGGALRSADTTRLARTVDAQGWHRLAVIIDDVLWQSETISNTTAIIVYTTDISLI